jgi:ribose transport system ATP-binding protein
VTAAALTVRNVSKSFAGTRALDGVGFAVAPGSVHALLGGNGSGKSTLIKILSGVYRGEPGGSIAVGDVAVETDRMTPQLARELGLRFVHQDTGVFQELTVAENIALVNGFGGRAGQVPWKSLRRRARALLDRFEIDADPDQPMAMLRPADQTMVAIARALEDDGVGLSTLVLDEPTASLPRHEVEVLLAAVRACAAAGQTIVFVSHRIDEVLAIADAVTVLRDGRDVFTHTADGLSEDELVRQIVGRPLQAVFPRPPEPADDVALLEVSQLSGGPLRDVSFTVRHGEVVGLAGLLGSGRTELLRMVFGAFPRAGGRIMLGGEEIAPRDAAAAMRLGIAYVPEDRKLDASFAELSVRANLSAARVGAYRSRGRFRHDRERADARADIERFGIRTAGDSAPLASLSGGNQQKVVLARWLRTAPRLLLLDEPTSGIDVGARADVFAVIDAAVADGLTVLLVSSDFEELSRVVDRVLVLADGRIVADRPAAGLDAQDITELVYSGTREAA